MEEVRRHGDQIIAARCAGISIPAETASWIGRLDKALVQRFVDAGILDACYTDRLTPRPRGDFIAEYLCDRTDIKASTRAQLKLTEQSLVETFGSSGISVAG
jgi:hypothetical protein